LIQFLSGVLGPDGIQADAMAWCVLGRTVVSFRDYFVNVGDNLGRRPQALRSLKDFLAVQSAAFICKPPLTVAQCELKERAAE
jgi:hypothetical protein